MLFCSTAEIEKCSAFCVQPDFLRMGRAALYCAYDWEPTMLYYDGSQSGVSLTIGKDAGYYHKECPNVLWNEERQPYGYAGVRRLFESLAEV